MGLLQENSTIARTDTGLTPARWVTPLRAEILASDRFGAAFATLNRSPGGRLLAPHKVLDHRRHGRANSTMPRSFGLASVKPLETMPTTAAFRATAESAVENPLT